MNKNITDIQKILGCSEMHALNVYDQLCANGVDFSECTLREFKYAVAEADKELRAD